VTTHIETTRIMTPRTLTARTAKTRIMTTRPDGPHLDGPHLGGPHLNGNVEFRGGGFAPKDRTWAAAATLAAVVALWQAGASAGVIPTLFLPAPVSIARALWALTISGELWNNLSISLMRLAVGWIVGTIFGIGMGLAVGLWSALRSPGMALVSALFPIPKIALVPLFIIWFGIGEGSKLATLAFGVFFPTVIATAGGVDNVPRGLIRMGQSFGLSHAAIIRKIVLPAALPAILSGFRVTSAIAIVLLVAAEMIGADRGIGAFVLSAGNLYDTENLLAGITVLSILGLTVSWVISRLEQFFLSWR
jgi:ABC-type nitrate/sulfonate/bicarbonate transport system permease component